MFFMNLYKISWTGSYWLFYHVYIWSKHTCTYTAKTLYNITCITYIKVSQHVQGTNKMWTLCIKYCTPLYMWLVHLWTNVVFKGFTAGLLLNVYIMIFWNAFWYHMHQYIGYSTMCRFIYTTCTSNHCQQLKLNVHCITCIMYYSNMWNMWNIYKVRLYVHVTVLLLHTLTQLHVNV